MGASSIGKKGIKVYRNYEVVMGVVVGKKGIKYIGVIRGLWGVVVGKKGIKYIGILERLYLRQELWRDYVPLFPAKDNPSKIHIVFIPRFPTKPQ